MFTGDITITEDHRYFTGNSTELVPVTTVIEAYKSEKDFVKIAYQKAYWQIYRELKLTKGSPVPAKLVAERQAQILQQWNDKASHGAGHGDKIHDIMWRFNTGQGISDIEAPLVKAVTSTGIFRHSERSYHEQIIGSERIGIAGMVDRLDIRVVKENMVDVTDYKTNLTGLSLDSVKIKEDGKILKLNNYMLEPISFMEECDYTSYCIQLGIYAYILEVEYGMKIGKLTIVYISVPQEMADIDAYLATQVTIYPVPYMRPVIESILLDGRWKQEAENIRKKKQERNKGMKPLPEIIPVTSAPEKEPETDNEVW